MKKKQTGRANKVNYFIFSGILAVMLMLYLPVGQAINVQTDPCSYADGGGTNCPRIHGEMNLRAPPFTFSTTTTNRVGLDMPRPAPDTFRYIVYRYGYITKKVGTDYQWVPFEFTFQNERTIPFDNKETKQAGKDIWIDVTNLGSDTAIAATADTAPELALTSLTNFYTDKPNFIVAWFCRCEGADCNNPTKGWNSANWECNPRTLGTKGVNNGRWVLRQFDVLANLLLTVVRSGSGGQYGIVSSAGIDCRNLVNDCSESYFGGPSVTLTATIEPSRDVIFGAWSGACTGTSTTCTIAKMNAEKSVTATFNINHPVLHSVVVTGTTVAVSYTKSGNFCTHLYNANNNPDQPMSSSGFCLSGTNTQTVDRSTFPNNIFAGNVVRLCADTNVPINPECNQFVTVTS